MSKVIRGCDIQFDITVPVEVIGAGAAGLIACLAAHEKGVQYLGMTGLGSGVGGLDRRISAKQQVQGIEDALSDVT